MATPFPDLSKEQAKLFVNITETEDDLKAAATQPVSVAFLLHPRSQVAHFRLSKEGTEFSKCLW